MKTFDELFKEVAEIGNKRKEVLDQLIERTEKELIPSFAKVLCNYNLEMAYFTMYNQSPFVGLDDSGTDGDGDYMYAYGIDCNGYVWKCTRNVQYNSYCAYERMRTKYDTYDKNLPIETNLPVVVFRRETILDFVKKLNNRIDELNKKYAKMIEEAESFLNKEN